MRNLLLLAALLLPALPADAQKARPAQRTAITSAPKVKSPSSDTAALARRNSEEEQLRARKEQAALEERKQQMYFQQRAQQQRSEHARESHVPRQP